MKDFFAPEDCDKYAYVENKVGVYTQAMTGERCISLARANALLRERGKVVYGDIEHDNAFTKFKASNDTHQALLVNVEEIAADSAEKLVKDLADCFRAEPQQVHRDLGSFIERARKLRGAK